MLRTLFSAIAMLLALALPSGAQAKLAVGISDQQAATFADPLFAPLHFTVARYIVPYDVTKDPVQTQKLKDWLAGAIATHQKILISFEHSRLSHSAAGKLPSPAKYKTALTSFKKLYGTKVADISPWNEVNRKYDPARAEGQPTWNKVTLVAQYYKVARQVFPTKHIVALDVLDQPNVGNAVGYVRKFKAAVKKLKLPAPKIWGIHPYSDINRFSTSRTKALLKATGSGDVWLTEASGIVSFGSQFPYDVDRAARADKCMFTIAKLSSRIKRLYVFGWPPGTSFDSGLKNTDGTTRPGYAVVQNRTAGPCKK